MIYALDAMNVCKFLSCGNAENYRSNHGPVVCLVCFVLFLLKITQDNFDTQESKDVKDWLAHKVPLGKIGVNLEKKRKILIFILLEN